VNGDEELEKARTRETLLNSLLAQIHLFLCPSLILLILVILLYKLCKSVGRVSPGTDSAGDKRTDLITSDPVQDDFLCKRSFTSF
jgi:hypothetical protein